MKFAGYVICGNPDKVGSPVVFSQFPTVSQNKGSGSSEVRTRFCLIWFVVFVGFYDLNFLNVIPCYIFIARFRMYGVKLRYYPFPPPPLTPSAARLPINKVSS